MSVYLIGKGNEEKKMFRFATLVLAGVLATVGIGFAHEDITNCLIPSPQPANLGLPPGFTEQPISIFIADQDLSLLEFKPSLYPDFADALPDAVCATWENGGLIWDQLGISVQGNSLDVDASSWGVLVSMPEYRFCGIPEPYPDKPEEST